MRVQRAGMLGNNTARGKQIEDLGSFVETSCQRLSSVLSILGWTPESVSESQPTLTCTFNEGHRIRRENFEDHLKKCQWKAEGYAEDELPLSEFCLSTDAWSAVNFEISHCCPRNVLNKSDGIALAGNFADRLIPRTSDRLVATFSSSERKAFYDHAIANTVKPVIGDDIADMSRLAQKNDNDPKTSLLELLVQERNLKRRRAKHRGVHTNKKSHIEIMREVINQQMEMYQEYLADTTTKEEPESSSSGSKTHLRDFHSYNDKKYNQRKPAEKLSIDRLEKDFETNNQGQFVRSNRTQTILPYSRSANYTSSDSVQKRNVPESRNGERARERKSDRGREMEREKHIIGKRKRDRSRERKRHEDGRSRHQQRDEDPWVGDESRQSRDKYDRRKRRRSRTGSEKSVSRSRRHEKSDNNHYRHQRY